MFYIYRLSVDMICLGERLKKGTYRPTIDTIPCSQIMGALEKEFGTRIPAAGYFTESGGVEHMTFSLTDHYLYTAKLPLTVEYLRNPVGLVFIKKIGGLNLPNKFTVKMGALKSKGFGRCLLEKEGEEAKPDIVTGRLKTRLYEDLLPEFGITTIRQSVFGYLFVPTGEDTGYYIRSLFEGSVVEGYKFLLEVIDPDGTAEKI